MQHEEGSVDLSMITHRYSEANNPIFTFTQFSHSICRGKDSDGFGKKRLINWINVAEDNAQEPQELHDLATY